MRFSDLPDAERMRLRDVLENAGAAIEGYYGDCVQVIAPAATWLDMCLAANAADLVEDARWLFPIGTYHIGQQYVCGKGYHMHINFKPA